MKLFVGILAALCVLGGTAWAGNCGSCKVVETGCGCSQKHEDICGCSHKQAKGCGCEHKKSCEDRWGCDGCGRNCCDECGKSYEMTEASIIVPSVPNQGAWIIDPNCCPREDYCMVCCPRADFKLLCCAKEKNCGCQECCKAPRPSCGCDDCTGKSLKLKSED